MKLKDKQGNELTPKEYFKRFKKGVEMITPLQQLKLSLMSLCLIIVGVCWGFYASLVNQMYWLTLILTGSFFLTTMNFLGMMQKYIALKKIMNYKGVQNEQVSTN
jgi:hypothetical protein